MAKAPLTIRLLTREMALLLVNATGGEDGRLSDGPHTDTCTVGFTEKKMRSLRRWMNFRAFV